MSEYTKENKLFHKYSRFIPLPDRSGDRIEAVDKSEFIEPLKEYGKQQRDNVGEHYEPYFGWCDVDGCPEEGCSGGNAWRDTGYWTVCMKHAQDFRDHKPQPKMKQEAIDKENSRDKKTGYLPYDFNYNKLKELKDGT